MISWKERRIMLLKVSFLLYIFVTNTLHARIESNSLLPTEYRVVIDYLNSSQAEPDQELLVLINDLGEAFKQYGLKKEDKELPYYLENILRSTFYKWILIQSSNIPNQKMNFEPKYPSVAEKGIFAEWLTTQTKRDLDSVLLHYPKLKKKSFNLNSAQFKPKDKKTLSLILPWINIIHASQSPDLVFLDLLPMIKTLFKNTLIKLQLVKRLQDTKLAVSGLPLISYTAPKKEDSSPKSNLPQPVDDWLKSEKTKEQKYDSRGLPLPVDDWILDF